jgi:hypothetical protein
VVSFKPRPFYPLGNSAWYALFRRLYVTQSLSGRYGGIRNLFQNYAVFGLLPSSGILGTRKHDVSEIGSVSVLR